jgi:hypothetical protein
MSEKPTNGLVRSICHNATTRCFDPECKLYSGEMYVLGERQGSLETSVFDVFEDWIYSRIVKFGRVHVYTRDKCIMVDMYGLSVVEQSLTT